MNDIAELEARISTALGRIAAAVSRPAQPDPELLRAAEAGIRLVDEVDRLRAEIARLTAALADEAVVQAQFKARNEALHAKLDAAAADAARLAEELAARDALAAQLRRVNAQLRQNNIALREANAQGIPDAHLINRAMLSELESIRASRDADRAEIDAVLAGLRSVVGEPSDA